MKHRISLAILFSVATAPFAVAQSFEVATVKPNTSGSGVIGGCHGIDSSKSANGAVIPLGRCVIQSARLSHLTTIAYGIQIQSLRGIPDWEGPYRYEVEGKAEDPSKATEAELLVMLQNLLADRFQLKVHREAQQVDGFALMVAKNGPKFKASTGEGKGSLRMTGAAIFKPDAIDRKNLEQNAMIGERTSMAQLANTLTYLPGGRPVIDKSGLDGFYDFKLAWEPGESLTSVLQEQLGLKLESQKVSIDLLVIDSAKKPAAN
jgi:uncharacterized protein (TIGR03435 family)